MLSWLERGFARRAKGKIFDGEQGLEITKSLVRIAQDANLDLNKVTA